MALSSYLSMHVYSNHIALLLFYSNAYNIPYVLLFTINPIIVGVSGFNVMYFLFHIKRYMSDLTIY